MVSECLNYYISDKIKKNGFFSTNGCASTTEWLRHMGSYKTLYERAKTEQDKKATYGFEPILYGYLPPISQK